MKTQKATATITRHATQRPSAISPPAPAPACHITNLVGLSRYKSVGHRARAARPVSQ